MNVKLVACRVFDFLTRSRFSRNAIGSVAKYELADAVAELNVLADILERDAVYPGIVDRLDQVARSVVKATYTLENEVSYLDIELEGVAETLENLGIPLDWAHDLHDLEESALYARFAIKDPDGVLDEDLDASLAFEHVKESIDDLLDHIMRLRGFKVIPLPTPPETETELGFDPNLNGFKPETELEVTEALAEREALGEAEATLSFESESHEWGGFFEGDEFELVSIEDLLAEESLGYEEREDESGLEVDEELHARWNAEQAFEGQLRNVFTTLTSLSERVDDLDNPELNKLTDDLWADLIDLDFTFDEVVELLDQAIPAAVTI